MKFKRKILDWKLISKRLCIKYEDLFILGIAVMSL